jgi:hypothetical protein
MGETSWPPISDPNTETMMEPETGTTIGSMQDIIGFEKEIRARETKVRLATEAKIWTLLEGPAGDLHIKRLSEIHRVASQDVPFTRNKGEMSKALKFKPEDVRETLPDEGNKGKVW